MSQRFARKVHKKRSSRFRTGGRDGADGTQRPDLASAAALAPIKLNRQPRPDSVRAPFDDQSASRETVPEAVQLAVKFHSARRKPAGVLVAERPVAVVEVDPLSVPGAQEGGVGELRCLSGSKRKLYFVFETQPSGGSASSAGSATISVLADPIGKLLDLKQRTLVKVRAVHPEKAEADVVEVYIRDVHLTRGDMWNMSGELVHQCVYRTQKVTFLQGVIKGEVRRIYRKGKKVFSAYCGENTRFVFRSESARLVVFIQISSEMWHFEESGQQTFYKLANSLFPQVFKRWQELGTHHLITIVLFTSVDLDNDGEHKHPDGVRPSKKQDFYRVVVDQVSILMWSDIMRNLRLEFANFKKDVLLSRGELVNGRILPAVKGNLLEAIDLGISLVSDDFSDPDLRQTTNHFIIVTPGTGLFDVDYNMLVHTGKLLASVDSTIDVICLSPEPLHIVPLFRYLLPTTNALSCCIPYFIDISFWDESSSAQYPWLPPCKIYDLQMMGVSENEMASISVEHLALPSNQDQQKAMVDYDKNVFAPPQKNRQPRKQGSAEDLDTSAPESSGFRLSTRDSTSVSSVTDAVGTPKSVRSNVTALSRLLSLRNEPKVSQSQVSKTNAQGETIQNTPSSPSAPSAFLLMKRMFSPELKPKGESPKSPNSAKSLKSPKTAPPPGQHSLERVPSMSLRSVSDPVRSPSPSLHLVKNQSQTHQPVSRNRRPQQPYKAYWRTLKNPSKVDPSEMLGMASYGRWQYVFPQSVRRRLIKWTSLATPAALPVMTPIFPDKEDFDQNFNFRIYDVLPSRTPAGEVEEISAGDLLRSMISMRLSLGFQICDGDAVREIEDDRRQDGDSRMLLKYFDAENLRGKRIYLSLADDIHRLYCDENELLHVQVYTRNDKKYAGKVPPIESYVENIRTRYSETYRPVEIKPGHDNPRHYNWNQIDQVLAGYSDSVEEFDHYHRLKFVILPSKRAANGFQMPSDHLSAEETRVEGIRSLAAQIHRARYRTSAEKRLHRRKPEIPPGISFYTGNLYTFLEDPASSALPEVVEESEQKPVVPQYNREIATDELAAILQSENGIPIGDRKWHTKTHPNSFVGLQLVDWLLGNFEDINEREDAIEYGNRLLSDPSHTRLFKHVNGRHGFLDGHYFYEIEEQYLRKLPPQKLKSAPTSPKLKPYRKGHKSSQSVSTIDSSTGSSRKVILSREVLCDLDPRGISWQRELVKVHYDIVHNPNHCFHVRLEWLNTTPKLIEDLVSGWEKHCERYALQLVETPWDEIRSLAERNHLHSCITLSLALDPLSDPYFSSQTSLLASSPYFYHLYLLEKCGFLLDNRTARVFSDRRFDVSYSWGKPRFKDTQFIHSTGGYIAELRGNGTFFLAPNNAHIARVNVNIAQHERPGSKSAMYFDSQSVMLDFRAICADKERLRGIFNEAIEAFSKSRDFEATLFEGDEEESV